ncbi:MAG: MFS transporter [Spirochaetales bacterium]|nr:MFS transporter [Spirochaetales bacterium]
MLFSFTISLFFYLQNFWKNNGYTEFQIGMIFAGASLLSGITSLFAQKIEKMIGGEKGLILTLPLLLILSLWGIALSPLKFPFYLIIGFSEGLLLVAISHYINRLIPSENRATVLSFQSMVFSFFMISLFPLIGWLGETFSLDTAFLVIAGTGTLIGLSYYSYRFMIAGKDL